MELSRQEKKDIILKFYDLFIVPKYKYLIMQPNGKYQTMNKYETNNFKELRYWQFEKHLDGEFTLGVFAASYLTKFVCFDIDVPNKDHAKWCTYQLYETLINLGIPENKIYISTSGNKGYHLDIYFNETLQNTIVKDFYDIVMSKMDLSNINGEIELRPTQQGLKLPLGINFKNKNNKTNRCWYVSYDQGLKPIEDYNYILSIEKLNTQTIQDIILNEKDLLVLDTPISEQLAEDLEEAQGYINNSYKPLINYNVGSDEKTSLEYVRQIEEEGIQRVGVRNKYLLTLCRYYKYLGMTREENIAALKEWIDRQDSTKHRASTRQNYYEIENMTLYAYEKDIPFIVDHKEISISYYEMLDILKAKSKNEKLLLYALVIHSKKYANTSGIFFMSYNQMTKSTGLGEATVKRLINKLEKQQLIHIVDRNIKILNKVGQLVGKRPNKYKITLHNYNDTESDYIVVEDITTFNYAINELIQPIELHTLLPRRQLAELLN